MGMLTLSEYLAHHSEIIEARHYLSMSVSILALNPEDAQNARIVDQWAISLADRIKSATAYFVEHIDV